MNNIQFARNLTKGKIAETIFWMMFRENEKYILLPFGYEYTIPELTQYRKYLQNYKSTIDKISSSPDFIMLSADKTHLYIVDIKYRANLNERLKEDAEKTLERWEDCYFFVATPGGFYFDACKAISQNNGNIAPLSESFVPVGIQKEYTKLLDEFMNIKTAINQPIPTAEIPVKHLWCPDCDEYTQYPMGNICSECGGMLIER